MLQTIFHSLLVNVKVVVVVMLFLIVVREINVLRSSLVFKVENLIHGKF